MLAASTRITGSRCWAEAIEAESGIEFARYLDGSRLPAVGNGLCPWRAAPRRPAGAVACVDDLVLFAGDLLRPVTVSPQMHAEATSVQFPGLDGVVPGFGMQRPNDWGLGFEIRDGSPLHWTGGENSAGTYGHFGQTGTLLWVDPARDIALVVLTDRDFGDWAKPLWPALSDLVLAEFKLD